MKPFNPDEYTVEYQTKAITLSRNNILVEGLVDGSEIEFWEDRLKSLKEDFVVAYKKTNTKVFYTIFCNSRKKESKFK